MRYDFIAIPDADVPQAVDPVFQHILQTYASEANKTVGVWRALPDELLDFKPHEKTNPIRTIFVHQLLSERRFFAQFVGTEEPPVEELLPAGEKPVVQAYIEKYSWLVKRRLPQLAQGTAAWWLESRPFFGGFATAIRIMTKAPSLRPASQSILASSIRSRTLMDDLPREKWNALLYRQAQGPISTHCGSVQVGLFPPLRAAQPGPTPGAVGRHARSHDFLERRCR